MIKNFRQRLTEFVDEILIRFSHHAIVDGLWIGSFSREHLNTIREALNLIKEHDEIKYRRILGDVAKIWMAADAGGMGKYIHKRRLIILNSIELEEINPNIVASVIIHEATHARLMRFGYEEKMRHRVERCCIRRELAFTKRYPDGEDIAVWISESLRFPHDAWSDASLRDMEREGAIKALRKLSVPKWIARILLDKEGRKLLG